jgi:hypothetical protein
MIHNGSVSATNLAKLGKCEKLLSPASKWSGLERLFNRSTDPGEDAKHEAARKIAIERGNSAHDEYQRAVDVFASGKKKPEPRLPFIIFLSSIAVGIVTLAVMFVL